MNIHDFRWMWQGNIIAPLLHQQANLLGPIDIRGEGRARALLLLHGFASSPAVFRELLPALTMYDAVVCPVLPGHADSIAAFSRAKAGDWLSAAEKACSDLLDDYPSVDVMGLSLGGLLACHLSYRFSLNHLYLLAPALSMHMNVPMNLMFARALHALGFRLLRNCGGGIHIRGREELIYRQLPISTIIQILTLMKDFTFEPPRCATDLFLGRFDAVVDSSCVATCFASLPNVTTHWLEHSAHILPLDGDIEAIVACVKAHHRL